MLSRTLAVCLVLFAIQSAIAEERSLLVAERVVNEKSKPAPPAKVGQAGSDTSAKVAPVTPAAQKPVPPTDSVVRVATAATTDGTPLEQMTKEVERLKAEIQTLRMGQAPNRQISVRVEICEVSLTKLHKFGTDVGTTSDGRLKGLEKALKMANSGPHQKDSNTAERGVANQFLAWLKENRIAKVLAEPSIVVTSGRPGQFFVGGEFPVKKRDDKVESVTFQRYGTEMDVLATILDTDRVQLQLRTRVSEINGDIEVDTDGNKLPGLNVRQCDTSVDTHFGEPVVLGGGVTTRVETSMLPDGKTQDVSNEIALVIIATPELVTNVADTKPESAPKSLK